MQTVQVSLADRPYPIHIGPQLLGNAELLQPFVMGSTVAVVTNETLAPMFLQRVSDAARSLGKQVVEIVLPDGEAFKTAESLDTIYATMLAAKCDRKTTILALGGGVIGDVAGYAAATYQRGIPFVQLPTTLLAQVDSSVGGKTAINHPLGKNMIGAFYQPQAVLSDTAALKSLPAREYASGLAEIIKHALIFDAPHLAELERDVGSSMPAMTKRWPGSLHTRAGSRRMWSGAMSGRRSASGRCSTWATPLVMPSRPRWAMEPGCTARQWRQAACLRRSCRRNSATCRPPMLPGSRRSSLR